MKACFFCVLILLCLGFSSPALADSELNITRVIDGETLELNDGRQVRLIGVNTTAVIPILQERFKLGPEKLSRLPVQNIRTDAIEYIEKHAVGKNIILSFDPSNKATQHRDPSGKLLAYVWYTTYYSASADAEGAAKYLGINSQDRLLNQELILMGRGLADIKKQFLQKESFLEAEQDAARSRRGFWRTASDIYKDMMRQAQGAQFGATAKFVAEEARASSLDSARQTYSDLIKMNPLDPKPYYERSWLGVSAAHRKISEENLKDIEQAISLSDFDPKAHMHKHFLMRFLGRHEEAQKSYAEAVRLSGKMGLSPFVSETVTLKIEEPQWAEAKEKNKSLVEDALRATINEEHYLFFLARLKTIESKEADEILDKVRETGNFKFFQSKHVALASASAEDILYETYWAKSGHGASESVIRNMETFGEVRVIEPADDNTIMVQKEPEEGKEGDETLPVQFV